MNLYVVIAVITGLALTTTFVFYMDYLETKADQHRLYMEAESENRRFEVTLTTMSGDPMQISSKYSTIRSEMNLQGTEFLAGKEIIVYPRLVNLGPEPVPITHGKPIFVVSVYDADDNLVWQYPERGLILSLSAPSWIDVEGTHLEHRSFILNTPGEYTVKSYASFFAVETKVSKDTHISVAPDLEKSKWRLYAEPVTITILSGNVGQQADMLEKQLVAIENQIKDLDDVNGSKIDSLTDTRNNVVSNLEVLYQKIDKLQTENVLLYDIPEEKLKKLEITMDSILTKYGKLSDDPNSPIEDVFIDARNESVVIMKNNHFDIEQDAIMTQRVADMELDAKSIAQADGVNLIVSELVLQSHTSTSSSPCNNDSERDDYCEPAAGGVQIKAANSCPGYGGTCETSTLGFPAHKDSVDGFVMAGHGVITDGDDDEAVYQEAYSNKIGNIVENHYDQNNQEFGCDCAFVELDSGRSVANEVIYDGLLLTING